MSRSARGCAAFAAVVTLAAAASGARCGPGACGGAPALDAHPPLEDRAATLPFAVPFVPQGPSLCGGAALAMVLRYWGERGVVAEDYRSLVSPEAGGITGADLAAAARRPGWRAAILAGSLEALRAQIVQGRPVIALIRQPSGAFHYVVVCAADGGRIRYHDPAVGPDRSERASRFLSAWEGSHLWGLVVTREPGEQTTAASPDTVHAPLRPIHAATPLTTCDALVDAGVQWAASGNPARAESLLAVAHQRFPRDGRPLRELAGLRFKEARWNEAATLAGQAVARAPCDTLAWQILATSRFMADDAAAALAAWNEVGAPRIDLVQVDGLERTRVPVVTRYLDLGPGVMLTPSRLRRAQRRMDSFPAIESAAVRYRLISADDAQVEAAVLERPKAVRGVHQVLGLAARAVGSDELRPTLAPTGNGERIDAVWRWQAQRPLIGLRLTAPTPRGFRGLVTLEGFRERETYLMRAQGAGVGEFVEETRRRGSIGWSDWVSGSVRLGALLAYDHWRGHAACAAVGARLEAASANDRWRGMLESQVWALRSGVYAGRAWLGFSPLGTRGGVALGLWGGFDAASPRAPLALLPGAGSGRSRAALLRAHPLLHDGVLEGPMFGRRLVHGGVEGTWWAWRAVARIGLAVFVDAARAWDNPLDGERSTGRVDAGIGLRWGLPGGGGELLRLDAAWGLSDRARAITIVATPWRFS